MSSIDDLFGDLGGVAEDAKYFVPIAASAAVSVGVWRAVDRNIMRALVTKIMPNNAAVLSDVVEAAVGVVGAGMIQKHGWFGKHSNTIALGFAVGLLVDSLVDLAATYLPQNIKDQVGLSGFGEARYMTPMIQLGQMQDPFNLLNAAPQSVEQMNGASVSVEQMNGMPVSVEEVNGVNGMSSLLGDGGYGDLASTLT
jgi:hypothetical protein